MIILKVDITKYEEYRRKSRSNFGLNRKEGFEKEMVVCRSRLNYKVLNYF